MRREALRTLCGLLALGLLAAGCGFQLRGQARLPFESAFIEAPPGSLMATQLTRYLRSAGKQVTATPERAQVRINIDREEKRKDILSLSGTGKVREYRLRYQLSLSALNSAGMEVLVPIQLVTTRAFSYDDTQVLAKEAEEARLQQDMDQEMLHQVLRRLAFATP